MELFNPSKGMLMQGDLDLNSVQLYADSFKEVMKKTILKQEVIFRTQVHELHQLYRTQKSLMKNLGCKGCDAYNSWDANVLSFLPPFTNPTRVEPLVKETGISSFSKVVSTTSTSEELLDGCQDAYYRFKQRPLDLQLSADEFINHVEEDLPSIGHAWNHCLKEPIDFKHPLSVNYSSGTEELKLSLTTGVDYRRTEGALRTWFDKKTHQYCSVIDLESDEMISDDHAKCTPSVGGAAPKTYFPGKHKSLVSALSNLIFSTRAEKDPSVEIAESSSFQEHSECCREQASSNEGIMELHDGILFNNLSTKIQQSTSHLKADLDLNKVYLDDPLLAYTSPASSASVSAVVIGSVQEETCPTTSWEKRVHGFTNEIYDIPLAARVDLNSTARSENVWTRSCEHNGISGRVVNLTGPDPMASSPVDIFADIGSCSGDHETDNVVLKAKLANGLLHDLNQMRLAAMELTSVKSQVEDAVFSCVYQSQNDRHGNQSPVSCKSGIYDNDSNSGRTAQCGNVSGDVNTDLRSHLGSQVADASSDENDLRTSNSCDLKNECYHKKEESAEVDGLMKRAAESLINLSLENSVSYQDSSAKEIRNETIEEPQYTCDSFELIVVDLTESNVDANSVTSKPYEVNDAETKDFGSKLRRGRRMKDFQKEILPALASLSRHEIHEDINIIEGVLRSREYRKICGKMARNGENGSPPLRSRRSRLNYAGRRNCSSRFKY